jgi:hypothetical protein
VVNSIIKQLQNEAKQATNNANCVRAYVAMALHLRDNKGDYKGACKEASYDLELSDEPEFKRMIKTINDNRAVIKQNEFNLSRMLEEH